MNFFRLTLLNLRKEIAMRGKKQLHLFYEEPFSETMNFETLVNWKIVNFFFPRQKDVRLFVFSTFFVNAHASWGWFIVKSPKICWFSCSAGLHTVFVLWGFCAFCKSIGLFTWTLDLSPLLLYKPPSFVFTPLLFIYCHDFLLFSIILYCFFTHTYTSKPVHMLFFF